MKKLGMKHEELVKQESEQITNAVKLSYTKFKTPLMPLLVHINMLLLQPGLSEK